MLWQWGLARADTEAVEAYLEASPKVKSAYEHFEFWEVERLIVLGGGLLSAL
jgi:hypothetical protein